MTSGEDRNRGRNGRLPEPDLPEQPAFYRHVLDCCPTPIVVVDNDANILYANDALSELSGYAKVEGVRTSIFEYIHPDDLEWIAEAFMLLAQPESIVADWQDRPWSPIHARMIGRNGRTIPIEVRGRDTRGDPDVGGIVYEIRPAHEREIFQRVLTGVAAGGRDESRLDPIMELLAGSPLDIRAAVLEFHAGGAVEVIAQTSVELAALLEGSAGDGEFIALTQSTTTPRFMAVDGIGGRLGADLVEAGFLDAWCVDVASPAPRSQHRLVGFTRTHHVPATGVIDALRRAAELASVVLLRSRTEALLEYAARHDELTSLPNRRGLLDRAQLMTGESVEFGVLFVDLDGFKTVNDRFGHATGDHVLREIAARIGQVTRPTDLVARLGGDEFAVVLSSASRTEFVTAVPSLAQRIIDAVDEPVETDRGVVRLSASIGYVVVDAAVGIEAALASADRAMYVAKRAGGARVHDGTIAHA